MKKFGGLNKIKQACINRICRTLNNKPKVSTNKSKDATADGKENGEGNFINKPNLKRNLSVHLMEHSDKNSLKCTKNMEKNSEVKDNKKASVECFGGGEKKLYTCSECEKNFVQKTNLNLHLMTHFGEKISKKKVENKTTIDDKISSKTSEMASGGKLRKSKKAKTQKRNA